MQQVKHPVEFYEFSFPDIIPPVLRNDHVVFSNYGHFEALNVEFNVSNWSYVLLFVSFLKFFFTTALCFPFCFLQEKEDDFVVSSKKRKPLIEDNDKSEATW